MQYLDRTMLTGLTQAATDIPNFQLDKWQTTTLSVQGQRTVFDLPVLARMARPLARGH
ncbi:MAG: hypothetical protein R2932_49940 [Caldilineaceae bacterium]